jgi:hypothetical protein
MYCIYSPLRVLMLFLLSYRISMIFCNGESERMRLEAKEASFMCMRSDGGVEWQGLIASEVEQKAPMRVLSCRVPSDIYHPHDNWQLFNPVIARGCPANLFFRCNSGLRSTRHTSPSHIHLSTARRGIFVDFALTLQTMT